MPVFRSRVVASVVFGLSVVASMGQTGTPASEMSRAAALYYTPTSKGLKSFRCDLAVDWKSLLEKAGGAPVPDSSPQLKYLRSAKLSVSDDLNGVGDLTWTPGPDPAPAGSAGLQSMRDGITTMWHGFFQSWNAFLNGKMVTVSGKDTGVQREGTGYHLTTGDSTTLVEEHYDAKLLLLSLHVKTPQLETTMRPTFIDTPGGRLVTKLDADYAQGGAPAARVSMDLKYATVSGYQLPSQLVITVPGSSFAFQLTGCAVNGAAPTH